jgi:hypothetical protein
MMETNEVVETNSNSTTIVFRSRNSKKKKKKKKRKRTLRVSEEDEEEDRTEMNDAAVLLKKMKRSRKTSGMDVKRLMVRKDGGRVIKEEKEDEGGLSEKKRGNLDGLLKGKFGTAKNVEKLDTNELLEQYIKERMGETDSNEKSSSKTKHDHDDENDVYRVPEDLRSSKKKKKNDSTNGGPMAFGTGIAEVELPDEYRLRNIEETEIAKSRILLGGKRKHVTDDSGNLTANYLLHQQNRNDLKGRSENDATDASVFKKFVSRELRSRRN